MSNLTEALYDVLTTDPTLAGLLSTYAGAPAVFTAAVIPPDATRPYVWSWGAISDRPFDSKTGRGREVFRDIRFYDDNQGSAAAVEAIAARIHALLHRQPLAVGAGSLITEISGPLPAPTDETLIGQVLTLRVVFEE